MIEKLLEIFRGTTLPFGREAIRTSMRKKNPVDFKYLKTIPLY